MATNVASSAAATAAAAGGGIVQTLAGAFPITGKLGLTPQQLQDTGVLKPGAAALAMANSQKVGATLAKALPPNIFTGKAGAESVAAIANNTASQVQIAIAGLQQGESALTQAGILTGKEAANAAGGVILATATAGLAPVANAINAANNTIVAGAAAAQGAVNTAQSIISGAQGALNTVTGTLNQVTNLTSKIPNLGGVTSSLSGLSATLNAGNFAASLGSIGGAFGAISGFLGKLGGGISNVINQAKGIAADAFNSIKNALPTLKPNVPQNLEAINSSAKASESGSLLAGVTAAVTGAAVVNGTTGTTGSVLTSAANALDNFKTTVTTAINSAGSVVTNAANTLAKVGSKTTNGSVDSAVASGVDMLPGGQNAISSITDYSSKVVNAIPGTGSIKTLVDNASTAVNNGISLSNSISSAVTSVSNTVASIGNSLSNFSLSGAANSLTGFLSTGLDKLKSLGLSSLVQAGLPAAAAAKLNSAISGLSSGLVKITTPQVGENTNNRDQLDAQTSALIGTAPPPNFSGKVSDATTSAVNAQVEKNDKLLSIINQIDELIIERDKAESKFNAANAEWTNLLNTRPQGDPNINLAKLSAKAAFAEVNTLNNKILSLRDQQYALQGTTGDRERDRIRGLQGGTLDAIAALRKNL
jgi:hypothetical protein